MAGEIRPPHRGIFKCTVISFSPVRQSAECVSLGGGFSQNICVQSCDMVSLFRVEQKGCRVAVLDQCVVRDRT